MYEHPLKRAGLSFNRILYSNSKMVLPCFPGDNLPKYKLSFKIKYFDGGREISRKYFTQDQMDELFPAKK